MGARRSPCFTELQLTGRQRISPYVLRLSAQMLVPIQIDNQNGVPGKFCTSGSETNWV